MGHGKAEAGQISRSGLHGFRGDIVQSGDIDTGDEQRMAGVLGDVLHGGHVPVLDFHRGGNLGGLALDGLTQGQSNTGRGLGQIFTKDEHRVMVFDLAQRRCRQRAVLQQFAGQLQAGQLVGGDTHGKVTGTHQFAQSEVAFQAGTR